MQRRSSKGRCIIALIALYSAALNFPFALSTHVPRASAEITGGTLSLYALRYTSFTCLRHACLLTRNYFLASCPGARGCQLPSSVKRCPRSPSGPDSDSIPIVSLIGSRDALRSSGEDRSAPQGTRGSRRPA